MSVQAMAWVFEYSKHKGSELLLMLAIANHAHSDGTNAFAGVPTLARECRLSEREVYRLIQKLELSGELAIYRKTGKSSRYAIIMIPRNTPDKMSGVTPDRFSQTPDTNDRGEPLTNSAGPLTDLAGPLTNGACHIRNITHEPMNPKKGGGSTKGIKSKPGTNGTPSPFSASPDSEKKPGIAYQKLADVCGIQLPATDREDSWLRAAIRDLRSKMESDDDANPEHETVTPRQAVQAIEALLNFWRSQDWRGKRGEFPKPAQLVESYGAAKVWTRN